MSAWSRRLALAPSIAERACGGAYRRSTHARVGASRNVSGTSSSSAASSAAASARASSVTGRFSKRSSSPAKGARSAAHDARVVHGASHGRSACIATSKASSRNGEAGGDDEDDTVSSEKSSETFFRRVSLSTTRRATRRASRSVTPKRATASARHTARKVLGSRSARRSNAPSRPCTRPNAVPADARTAAATAGGTTTAETFSRLSSAPPRFSAPPENSSSSSPPPTPPAETHAPCLVAAHSPATNGAATRAYSGVAPCGAAAFTSAAVSKQWWCPRSSAEPALRGTRSALLASFGAPLVVSRKRAPSASAVGDTDASTKRVCSTVMGGIGYTALDAGAPETTARATERRAAPSASPETLDAFCKKSAPSSRHASTKRTASGGDCGSHLKCARRSTRCALDAAMCASRCASSVPLSSVSGDFFDVVSRSSVEKDAGAFSLGSRPATAAAPTPRTARTARTRTRPR